MEKFVADTHAIIWYLEGSPKLGGEARRAFDLMEKGEALILISIISFFEMDYIIRKGKIDPSIPSRLEAICQASENSALRIRQVDTSVFRAFETIQPAIVPEMPDRIIAATAMVEKGALITKDRKMQGCEQVDTIW